MKRIILILTLLTLLIPSTVHAQDEDPWGEVFDENGNLQPDLVDLGVTTEHPEWMSVDLPFGQSLNLDANYHRYQTPQRQYRCAALCLHPLLHGNESRRKWPVRLGWNRREWL